MATEIAFSTSVDTGEGAKSLKSLKQEFKETQKELDGLTAGSEKYVQTLQKLGKIKDDIGDLNDEIKAFSPEGKVQALGNVIGGVASGFQAATGAAALFGAGSEDLQKSLLKVQAVMAFTEGIKGLAGLADGFKVLGNVIKSNPIYLIGSIIIGIGTALFALKDKISIVGDAFDAIGDVIGYVIDKVKEFTDWIGISSFASDELAATQIANAQKVGQAVSDRYDREIARAAAAGKSTEEIERKKQLAIIETLKLEAVAIVQAAKARGEFTEEENKRFTELIALTQKAADEIVIIDIKKNTALAANDKKAYEDHKKILDKRTEDAKKLSADLEFLQNINLLKEKEVIDDGFIAQFEANQKKKELDDAEDERKRKRREKEIAAERQAVDDKLRLTQIGISSSQNLFDIGFAIRMAGVKKGSKEEEQVAKRQFDINKKLNIASTAINTIMGVRNALIPAPGTAANPLATALRIAAAIQVGLGGAAAIAKIAATQFGGGSSGGGGIPSIASPTIGEPPSLNAPTNTSTLLNPDGTVQTNANQMPIVIQNNISETAITNVQKGVNTIQQQATIK